MSHHPDLIPVAYSIRGARPLDMLRIESRSQPNGDPKWCVKDGHAVLNKDLEWEHEPLPSSRDDAFIARTRWATAEEAYEAYKQVVR